LNIFWITIAGMTVYALFGFVKEIKSIFAVDRRRAWILLSLVGVVLTFAVLVLWGYFGGRFPVIQGRFILPVDYAVVLIIALGICRSRWASIIFAVLIVGLVIVDAHSLFDNILMNFYFYSSFFSNGEPIKYVWHGWDWATRLVITKFIEDKPFWVIWGAFLAIPAYIFLLLVGIVQFSQRFFTKNSIDPQQQ
jgi:hypothetical protein